MHRKKNPNKSSKRHTHNKLEGFEVKINSLGEIISTLDIDEINRFLDKRIEDKKIRERKKDPGKD